MSEFTTYLEIAGFEVMAKVSGDYQPEESMTATYPGCAEAATIGAVECMAGKALVDILPILNASAVSDLEVELIEHEEKISYAKRHKHRHAAIAMEVQAETLQQSENQRGISR